MRTAMRIYTIEDCKITEGVNVDAFRLRAGTTIPAVLVGEEGKGRRLGVLPVAGANPGDILLYADVGLTQNGRPKLIARAAATTNEKAVVVLRSPIGYRGSNEHTGDRRSAYYLASEYDLPVVRAFAQDHGLVLTETPDGFSARLPEAQGLALLQAGLPEWRLRLQEEFEEFPGRTLAHGIIADGQAGNVASGEQLIAVVPRNVWFRVGFTGRRYGAPRAWYYRFDGNSVVALTWEQRQAI